VNARSVVAPAYASSSSVPSHVPAGWLFHEAWLAEYAGRFYSAELDAEYVLEAKDGGLVVKRKNQEDRRLLPTAADSFSEGSVRIRFLRDGRGRPSGFLFGEGDVSDLEFVPD
jgi:hypothetical protein